MEFWLLDVVLPVPAAQPVDHTQSLPDPAHVVESRQVDRGNGQEVARWKRIAASRLSGRTVRSS